jgi:hypothetical protein
MQSTPARTWLSIDSVHEFIARARDRVSGHPKLRKVLLLSGIGSSVLYVVTDVVASLRYSGYSYADQMISELMAVEAPTRQFMIAMFVPYNLLVLAFAAGVWASADQNRALRVTAGLLAAFGVVGFVGLFLAPMHARGVETSMTGTDMAHIATTAIIVLLTLLYVGFGAAARGKQFRVYSIVTILLMVVFGTLTGLSGSQIAANEPTPWMGLMERVSIYAQMLWIAVLAIALLRANASKTT